MSEPKALPSPNQAVQPAWYGYDAEPPDQSAVPLTHYLWILRRHCWKILGFVLGCVAATVIISARLTPIYESTATVDIDRQMPSAAIGQDATRIPADDADQFLATQVKIIQSDSVLRPIAEQYHLLDVEKQISKKLPRVWPPTWLTALPGRMSSTLTTSSSIPRPPWRLSWKSSSRN